MVEEKHEGGGIRTPPGKIRLILNFTLFDLSSASSNTIKMHEIISVGSVF